MECSCTNCRQESDHHANRPECSVDGVVADSHQEQDNRPHGRPRKLECCCSNHRSSGSEANDQRCHCNVECSCAICELRRRVSDPNAGSGDGELVSARVDPKAWYLSEAWYLEA